MTQILALKDEQSVTFFIGTLCVAIDYGKLIDLERALNEWNRSVVTKDSK